MWVGKVPMGNVEYAKVGLLGTSGGAPIGIDLLGAIVGASMGTSGVAKASN